MVQDMIRVMLEEKLAELMISVISRLKHASTILSKGASLMTDDMLDEARKDISEGIDILGGKLWND